MADNIKALTKALAFMAEFNAPSTPIANDALPPAVAAAFKQLETDENIPVDDSGTSVDYFRVSLQGNGIADVFIGDYSGDDPDQFRIIGAVQDGAVIGTSSDVAS